jgi:hypothetical protein
VDDLERVNRATKRAGWCRFALEASVHDLEGSDDPELGAIRVPMEAAARQEGKLTDTLGTGERRLSPLCGR